VGGAPFERLGHLLGEPSEFDQSQAAACRSRVFMDTSSFVRELS
jgi:hypothetical protein